VPVLAQIIVPMFGYKNHTGIDRAFGFIRKWVVTHADRHARLTVEHVFAVQKSRMALLVRAIGIERARVKIDMANLASNFKRLVWHEGRSAPA
jgi:hypothetical protein